MSRALTCVPLHARTLGGGDFYCLIGPFQDNVRKGSPRVGHAQHELEVVFAVPGVCPGARTALNLSERASTSNSHRQVEDERSQQTEPRREHCWRAPKRRFRHTPRAS